MKINQSVGFNALPCGDISFETPEMQQASRISAEIIIENIKLGEVAHGASFVRLATNSGKVLVIQYRVWIEHQRPVVLQEAGAYCCVKNSTESRVILKHFDCLAYVGKIRAAMLSPRTNKEFHVTHAGEIGCFAYLQGRHGWQGPQGL